MILRFPPRKVVVTFGFLALLPSILFASLAWDSRVIELVTKPGDTTASGTFHFVNSGDATVTIIAVVPGCGCTSVEMTKRVYAPGEAGDIKAVLTIGDRTGLQDKTLQVITDDAPAAPVVLNLRVTIPEPLTLSSRVLLWRTSETVSEKSVIVTNVRPQKIVEIEPNPSPSAFVVPRIEILEPGVRYRVSLLPATIDQPVSQLFSFVARFTDNTTRQFTVFLEVK
jgi:hypothetical protein